MKIKHVKLVQDGMKGLEVAYLKTEMKEGREFPNEHLEKRKHPIHMGLETPFKDLRNFLLDICDYFNGELKKKQKDQLILETEMTGITIGEGWFILTGKKRVFDTLVVSLNTPKIDETAEYKDFDTVMKIIDKILQETQSYMQGNVKVTDQEILIRYAEKKDIGMSFEQINDLNAEEQKELCTKILEKQGSVVIHNEDVEPEHVDISEEKEVFKEKTEEIIPLQPQLQKVV